MNQSIKRFTTLSLLLLALVLSVGCSQQSTTTANKTLKIGATAGPHAEILEVVKKVAEKDGLQIEIVEFNDYIQPNIALNQGDIDVNSFQHQPYLENIIKDRKFDLTSIAKTVIFPMGIYSKNIKNITDLPERAIVAIPNDPTNGGRALLLLERLNLIKLKPNTGFAAAVTDIIANPKNITIKELDAAQIPRSLADMDVAAINTNYALTAGLVPTKDAIAIEDGDSPYANILAVRTKDKNNPALQKLIKAYHSDEVKAFIQEHFKGSVTITW